MDWDRKSSLGLAIPDAPFKPDVSPITAGTEEKTTGVSSEPLGGAQGLAGRLEQRLWKYSASKNVMKRWMIEIISWCVSAVCMAGIVVTLFIYKNKPIPNWPLGITLNAYISVLAKIASAGLLLPVSEALGQLKWSWFNKGHSQKMWDFELFDNASRGPWGSLLLLVRTKGKSLAALGAAVTVFALALDPFFQQVVKFPNEWRMQPEYGTIPRAIGYKPYAVGLEYRRDLGQMLGVDQKMQGISNSFLFDNGTAPVTFGKGNRAEVPLECPSSNCTWSRFETLGIRSDCTDVSDLLEFKCQFGVLDWIQKPEPDPETKENLYPNGTACGWWLKADDPLLMTGYNVDRDTPFSGELLLMRAQPLYDLFTKEPLPGYPTRLNDTRNPLAHVVIVSGGSAEKTRRNDTAIAHECIITWAVNEMTSEYSEGGYQEKIEHVVLNTSFAGSSPWVTTPFFDEDGLPAGTDYRYMENVTIVSRTGQAYILEEDSHTMTMSLFDEAFPSQYTLANSTNETDAMLRYKQYVTINPWTRNVTYNPFMFPNITQHMKHMASALTDMLRSAEDNTVKITGPSFAKESIVSVRWAWLGLPLGLLGLTFVFLTATIVRSSMEQENIGVYKTSAIATLLYGLGDDMQKRFRSSQVEGTPRANAKQAKVKWVPKRGWRFSGSTVISNLSPVEKEKASPQIPDPNEPAKKMRRCSSAGLQGSR